MAETKNTSTTKTDRFYKSRKNRMIDGVCAGLADYLGVDATLVRVLWFLSILVNGVGVIAYIVAAVIVPVNPAHKDLKENEKRKGNIALIVGLVLVLLGIFYLYNELDLGYRWHFPFHLRHLPFWSVPWGMLWPLALIILGIWYIVHVMNKNKDAVDVKETPKAKKEPGGQKKTASRNAKESGKLYRSRNDMILSGVCGGIAKHLDIDATLVRIGFAVLAVLTHVVLGIIVYVVLVAVVPLEDEAQA